MRLDCLRGDETRYKLKRNPDFNAPENGITVFIPGTAVGGAVPKG